MKDNAYDGIAKENRQMIFAIEAEYPNPEDTSVIVRNLLGGAGSNIKWSIESALWSPHKGVSESIDKIMQTNRT